MKLILASASPSRAEILKGAGLEFTVEVSDYQEDNTLSKNPTTLVKKLSQYKARAVAAKHKDAIIIGADTVGVIDNKIIGKPRSKSHARTILKVLSGRPNISITGLTIINTATNQEITKIVKTKVYFRKLTKQDIEDYLATGEWENKAGAYAMQGKGRVLVAKVVGDYYNVCGLPIASVMEILKILCPPNKKP